MPNAIFIAATGQNVGKTTLCLGLIAALKKRYPTVGFIKPVGQQHVQVPGGVNVDKDVVLFKEHYHLDTKWDAMSPVIIPKGFTRDYLDGKVDIKPLIQRIKCAFSQVSAQNAYTVVEGTGHIGVGSIVGLNNAFVASQLGLDIVIIASGGLGSAFDELALNIAMCRDFGVKVRGVIMNRVLDSKRKMIMEYVPKCLERFKVPLIGCIPFDAFLSNPTVRDFEMLFGTELLSGHRHEYRHFEHTRLVACSVEAYQSEIQRNELVITPASREDIIRAILKKHVEEDYEGGMILTGRLGPTPEILEEIRRADVPVLFAPLFSYDAMKKITSFIAKIRKKDLAKVERAIELIEKNVNFDLLTNA